MSARQIVIIGGGAAGFFAAIAAAEARPGCRVIVLEATAHCLAKVRISGGGRCNVTNAQTDPREVVKRYPRGGRELLGPLHRFGPRETVAWFRERGVELKAEPDGRMFPITDDSATVIDCLEQAAAQAAVEVRRRAGVKRLVVAPSPADGSAAGFTLELMDGDTVKAERVVIATGGNRGSAGLGFAAELGHVIEPPVPSLFTFHIEDDRLRGLAGLSVADAEVRLADARLRESGPLLVTHWGLSGPAVLKLSAWGARELAAREYQFPLQIAWVAGLTRERAAAELAAWRETEPRRQVVNSNPWGLPARLWERLVAAAGVAASVPWGQVSKLAQRELAGQVAAGEFRVTGKSLNKEEFVTCGGVSLREVDFRTMESRRCVGIHFAGEVLDIDGVTGGFNFQAAWTTGWIAGHAAAAALEH